VRKIAGTGWVKLYRDINQHWIFDDPVKLKIWIVLLTRASHKKTKVNVGYQLVELLPGQLVFGLNKFSSDISVDRSKLYRIIKMMADDEMIDYDTETYNNFSIITIRKWQHYQSETPLKPKHQGKEQSAETEVEQIRNGEDTAVKTNNNVKNEKNGKKYIEKKAEDDIVPADEIDRIYNSLSEYWCGIYKTYIDIYRSKNKSGKITNNRHYKLLKELNQIYLNREFRFDGNTYRLTEDIFEYGINQIIEREVDNLNYAKKIWLERVKKRKGDGSDRVSKAFRGKAKRDRGPDKFRKKIPDYNKNIKWG